MRRNHFSKAIEAFTPQLFYFQKLLSWGGNEDEIIGDIFNFIYFWLSKRGNHHKTNNLLIHPMEFGSFIQWFGAVSTWVSGCDFTTRVTGGQKRIGVYLKVCPSELRIISQWQCLKV